MAKGVKGNNHNPNGRPVGSVGPAARIGYVGVLDIRNLAKAWTHDSIQTLADIMKDVAAPPATRVAAANSLLDRAWGKPSQSFEATINNNFDDKSDDELRRLIAGTIVRTGPDSGRVRLEGLDEELSE